MTANHSHPTPVPPNDETPLPTWVVTTGNDHDGYEIAALFADGHDAHHYATWWNREELHRYGTLATHATATALPEEIDFYPTGTWRPPTQLHLTEPNGTPNPNGSPDGREPTIGRSTNDPFTPVMSQLGVHHQHTGISRNGTT